MRKTISLWCIILLWGGFFLMPRTALAFSQQFYENGWYHVQGDPLQPLVHYNFDKIEAFLITASEFEAPALTVQNAGWEAEWVNPQYAVASGPPATGNLYFTIFVAGDGSTPLTWDIVVWAGDTIIGNQRSSWNQGWTFTELTLPPTTHYDRIGGFGSEPIPLPGTLMLMGIGLVGLTLWGRQTRRGR